MKNTKYIFTGIIGIIIFFTIGFIYSQYRADRKSLMLAVSDGEYYVQITNVDLFKKEALFKHITYFSGNDAFNSAEYEVKCDKEDITLCVPSLKRGYYIRPTSSELDFTVGLDNSKIFLASDKTISASLEALNSEINLPEYESAFKINVKNGKVATIEEITRYNNSEDLILPRGYTLDSYKIEKITSISCKMDSECKTPGEYLIKSNCPYTSICQQDKCVIICPDSK
ncbi:MAG: hypothetical protein PHR47_00170 [Candidatus Pacebacteria bacterium]|nr:hypothetical protein [Candidatus Paceibacterota bacterium]